VTLTLAFDLERYFRIFFR